MEYIYSALVLHSAGKPINEENLIKVLEAAGITPDKARVKALTASLEGVNIKEVLASANTMVPAATAAPTHAPKEEKKEEKKKEEKKEEKGVSEEEAAAGLGALFG